MRSLYVTIALVASSQAMGETISVQFTNEQPVGGFSTSPFWFSTHNGSFDYFDAGETASQYTERLAELGVGAALDVPLDPAEMRGLRSGNPGHVQFTPGDSNSLTFDIADPARQRWFSYGFMLVPSNDFFFGNDDPFEFEIFDAAGNFRGPVTIQIFGHSGWEAATERNDVDFGPAFLVGRDPFSGAPEDGRIRPLFSDDGQRDYLARIVGMDTPAYTVTDGLTESELLATILITPEPASFGLLLLGLAAVALPRR